MVSPKMSKLLCSTDNLQVIEISSDSEDEMFCQPHPRSTVQKENRSCSVWQNDVIELTDSESSNSSDLPDLLSPLVKRPRRKGLTGSRRRSPSSEEFVSLYADASDAEESDKDCILVLNDPRGFRRPIRTMHPSKGQDVMKAIPSLSDTPKSIVPEVSQGAPKTPNKRIGSSVHNAKEQVQRQKYATELFAELNEDVFGDRLPKDTNLEWSKRLLTTAGRAHWHRSREGGHTTKIELASKILDCDERIRNTLSHEMCHLACWVIDDQPREGHGQIFKSWARKVMYKRPDIHISTRHTYEISYPYKWQCQKCSKIYGRYSKSIRPDECVCGCCKVGKLHPLFVEKKTRTPKGNRMVVSKPRESPFSLTTSGYPSSKHPVVQRISTTDDNSIPDLAALVDALGCISVNDTSDWWIELPLVI